MKMLFLTICLTFLLFGVSNTLDNGLADAPPMGWMHWQRFRCVIDCETYPDECVSEQLFRNMADLMVSEGYLEAGYEYIIVDDCWASKKRALNGSLVADPVRFPNGIKALADYVHSKGLKFGLYGDYGNLTCAGYPGSIDHMELDVNTFAAWGVDYIKLDGCYADQETMEQGYAEYGRYMNETGRPMVYSCSWPAYQEPFNIKPNYHALRKTCNLWRNWDDIDDSWESVSSIVTWFVKNQDRIAPFSGPGHWNDPDMLIIGNYGLTVPQAKAQMTIWSIMSAPLIMSNDLRAIDEEYKKILLNRDAIAINQDYLGKIGKQVLVKKKVAVWTKVIMPNISGHPSYAVGIVSNRTDGFAYKVDFSLKDLNLDAPHGYFVQNVFEDQADFDIPSNGSISMRIIPTGGVLLKLTPRMKSYEIQIIQSEITVDKI